MPEQIKCQFCKQPKPNNTGSLTQWIVSCKCAPGRQLTPAKSIGDMCRKCKKRIGSGRAGTLTQYIFLPTLCHCEVPAPDVAQTNESGSNLSSYAPAPAAYTVEDDLVVEGIPEARYKPLARLGSGASGSVYLCQDNHLNKLVAIKTLHLLTDEGVVRFQQEARATSKMVHPNIITVLDFGAEASSIPYMVLEYVDGFSLERYLKEHGCLTAAEAFNVFDQVCDALSYAHEQGVYHRDVKPSNILLERNSGLETCGVKLIDFGVAGVKQETQEPTIFRGKNVVGTPAYTPPDLVDNLTYDARSEVYSVGCVLFEALAGRQPFRGATAIETISMHLTAPPPVLEGDSFDSSLSSIVSQCMAKDPGDRFQSMMELRSAFAAASGGSRSTYGTESRDGSNNRLAVKRSLILVAAVAAAAVVVLALYLMKPTQEVQDTAKSKSPVASKLVLRTFKSAFNDLTFQYPGNWILSAQTGDPNLVRFERKGLAAGTIDMRVWPDCAPTIAAALDRAYLVERKHMILQERKLKIGPGGNMDAIELDIMRAPGQPGEGRERRVYFGTAARGYSFFLFLAPTADEHHSEEKNREFEIMLNSAVLDGGPYQIYNDGGVSFSIPPAYAEPRVDRDGNIVFQHKSHDAQISLSTADAPGAAAAACIKQPKIKVIPKFNHKIREIEQGLEVIFVTDPVNGKSWRERRIYFQSQSGGCCLALRTSSTQYLEISTEFGKSTLFSLSVH